MDFNQKMGKTVAAKLVLTFLPYRLWTCHLSREKSTSCPLGQRSTILVGFCIVLMLHCQTSTSLIDDSSNLNKVMKLIFCEWYIDKVGAVWLTHCCVVILVVGIIFDYVFMKHCLYFKKKAVKIGAPKFWPSYHYSSVVRAASNWNLQKLLKSEL